MDTQAVVGTLLLAAIGWFLWTRVGFAVGKKRSQGWAAIAVLYALWGVHLLLLGRETGFIAPFTALLFAYIALHRKRMDDPESKTAIWLNTHVPEWMLREDRK